MNINKIIMARKSALLSDTQSEDQLTETIEIKLTSEEKDMITKLSKDFGSESEYIRQCLGFRKITEGALESKYPIYYPGY
jgi:hypothetical protein